MLYGTVSCFTTAHVSHINSINDSDSNNSLNSSDIGSNDTSSSDESSNSQPRMLASHCNSGGGLEPYLGLR